MLTNETNCLLEGDINNCVHFCRETAMCKGNNKSCGMYNKNYMVKEKKYRRERRWYEKYYKKGDFVS